MLKKLLSLVLSLSLLVSPLVAQDTITLSRSQLLKNLTAIKNDLVLCQENLRTQQNLVIDLKAKIENLSKQIESLKMDCQTQAGLLEKQTQELLSLKADLTKAETDLKTLLVSYQSLLAKYQALELQNRVMKPVLIIVSSIAIIETIYLLVK